MTTSKLGRASKSPQNVQSRRCLATPMKLVGIPYPAESRMQILKHLPQIVIKEAQAATFFVWAEFCSAPTTVIKKCLSQKYNNNSPPVMFLNIIS